VMILNRGLRVENGSELTAPQIVTKTPDGRVLVNGSPQGRLPGEQDLRPVGHVSKLPGGVQETGPLGPIEFLSTLQQSEVILWRSKKVINDDDSETTTYTTKPTPGSEILRPGNHPIFQGLRGESLTP